MPWPKGKKQSPESVEKRRRALQDPEVKAKMRRAKQGGRLTDEHKAKIGESLRGHTLGEEGRAKVREANSGKSPSAETRRKLSEAMQRQWEDPEYRERMSDARKGRPGNTGYKPTPETLEKLRQSHLGKTRTVESRLKQGKTIAGPNHHTWKGGPLPSKSRGVGWALIKQIVRERADGRCELCGGPNVHGWQLDVHHVIPYRDIPISADWACLALCRSCHNKAERGTIDLSEQQAALRPRLEALLEGMPD